MAKTPFALASVFQQGLATFTVRGSDVTIDSRGVRTSTPVTVVVGFALDLEKGSSSKNQVGSTYTSSGVGYITSVDGDENARRIPLSIHKGDAGSLEFLDSQGDPIGEKANIRITGFIREFVDPIITDVLGQEIGIEVSSETMRGAAA